MNNYKKIYELSYKFLLQNLPDGLDENRLQDYFIADGYKNLGDIYNRILISAQNRQAMPNTIKMCDRQNEIRSLLHDYDFDWITSKTPEYFLNLFKEHYQLSHTEKGSYWSLRCKTIIDGAWFMKRFKNVQDFESFVKDFDTSIERRWKLSEYIAEKIKLGNGHRGIKGLGEALTCDFLKEIGFINYLKPDVHIIEICYQSGLTTTTDEKVVFVFLSNVAEASNVTPYKLDKIIWLICSGNFYKEKINKKEGHKTEFIKYLGEKLGTKPLLDSKNITTKKEKIKTNKSVKQTNGKQNLFEFRSLLNQYITEKNLNIPIKKLHNESGYEAGRLSPTSQLYIERLSRTNTIRVSVWIKKDFNTFDKLHALKDDIERDFGYNLIRERSHGTGSSSIIYYEIPGINFNDKSNYLKQTELATTFALKLKEVFKKYI